MRIKTLFSFVSLILLSACSNEDFLMADGSRQSLGQYKGQWLLINYWAEWCRPCLEEIPELNTLDKQPEFQVIGFDYDKDVGQALINKIERVGIEFPVMLESPAEIFNEKEPGGLPATMLVNKEGQFSKWLMGPQTIDSIRREVEK